MRAPLLIARHDLMLMLRQRETLLWIFFMPLVFIYGMGLTMSGFTSPGGDAEAPDPIALRAPPDSGFIVDVLIERLKLRHFSVDHLGYAEAWADYDRRLELTLPAEEMDGSDPTPTQWVLAGNTIGLRYESSLTGPNAIFDRLRVARSVYGLVADAVVIDLEGNVLSEASFDSIAAMPRNVSSNVRAAGLREGPPSGFAQSVPGTLVMFTMLILTTAGAIFIVSDRNAGLFRRLAATPITRGQVVFGKFLARIGLAAVQIAFAMLAGMLLFGMDWGSTVVMVLAVLICWGAFNASLSMVLGNLARTEAQAYGMGILVTLVLAALGGAWWPIEVTPAWMRQLALLLPTGWTMDAMHQLVNFGYPASKVVPHVAALLAGALVLGWLGARTFRYE